MGGADLLANPGFVLGRPTKYTRKNKSAACKSCFLFLDFVYLLLLSPDFNATVFGLYICWPPSLIICALAALTDFVGRPPMFNVFFWPIHVLHCTDYYVCSKKQNAYIFAYTDFSWPYIF